MAQRTIIRINHENPAVPLGLGQFPDSDVLRGLQALVNFLIGVITGVRHADIEIAGNAAQATGTATFGTTDGNITINGVNLAYTGANANARCANAVSVINASVDPLVAGFVTAVDGGAGTLTLTATQPGKAGNAITLAITGTGASVSGARMTGGTESFKRHRKGL